MLAGEIEILVLKGHSEIWLKKLWYNFPSPQSQGEVSAYGQKLAALFIKMLSFAWNGLGLNAFVLSHVEQIRLGSLKQRGWIFAWWCSKGYSKHLLRLSL